MLNNSTIRFKCFDYGGFLDGIYIVVITSNYYQIRLAYWLSFATDY